MKDTLEIINQMQSRGVIQKYAIGGAVGATLYLAKDHARVLQFLEQNAVDSAKLQKVLSRHALLEKWQKFKRRYLDE